MARIPTARNRLEFVPQRLRQARLANGLSVSELAVRIGVDRSLISLYENGRTPSSENWGPLSQVLGVDRAYFAMPIHPQLEQQASAINFRALKKSPVSERQRARALIEWAAFLASRLETFVGLPSPRLPAAADLDPADITTDVVEEAANSTRQFFRLGVGPIADLTLLLENHGVIVAKAPLHGDMDGLSAFFDERPIILIKDSANYFRSRFDLAHELGHLVLHRHIGQEELDASPSLLNTVEKQAHQFASFFLMPETGFLPEALHTDIDALLELKDKWGVSMQAIVRRLYESDVISSSSYKRLQVMFTRSGYRRVEPKDDSRVPERPRLLKRAAEFATKEAIAPFHEVFVGTRLPTWFLCTAAGLTEQDLVPSTLDVSNVLTFKSRTQ
jgi:Zn-dependent peptidase ImmA (M78 family)/transcriptional regulator with XRE-family HTH domain